MKRASRILLWSAAIIVGLTVVLLAILNATGFQTRVAQRVLSLLNESWQGELRLSTLHVNWNGQVAITGIELNDPQGARVVIVDSLSATIDFRKLLRDTVALHKVVGTGIELALDIDSTGTVNLATVFEPRQPKSPDSSASPLVVSVDDFLLRGNRIDLSLHEQTYIAGQGWLASGSLAINSDSLVHSTTLDIDQWLQCDLGSTISLSTSASEMHGVAGFIIREKVIAKLPEPLNKTGSWSGHSTFELARDSLSLELELSSETVGHVAGNLKLPLDLREPGLQFALRVDSLHPGMFWDDTTSMRFTGFVAGHKTPTSDWINGWNVQSDFSEARYGLYHADQIHATVAIADSTLILTGQVSTHSGFAEIDFVLNAFDEPIWGRYNIDAHHMSLSDIGVAIPDSISQLSGNINGTLEQSSVRGFSADAVLRLRQFGTTSLQADSLLAFVTLRNDSVTIDSAVASVGALTLSGQLSATANGLTDGHMSLTVSTLADLRKTAFAALLPDSLDGSLQAALVLKATPQPDGSSHTILSGDVNLTDVSFKGNNCRHATVKIIQYDPDERSVIAAAHARSLVVASQLLDSLTIVARGTLDELNTQLQLWAITDTAEIRADMTLSQQPNSWQIVIHQLLAATYGINWKIEGTSAVVVSSHSLTVDALFLESDYGKLFASGTISSPGEQDIALELSGVQIADWANLFRVSVPQGLLNARITIAGPDDNISGDISATLDSVHYETQLLADRVTLEAEANSIATSLQATYTLAGDTIATARGSLPARLTFGDGFVLNPELPMSGRVLLRDRPWSIGYPLLPYGSTVAGRLSGEFTVLGSPARPNWLGDLKYRDGLYRDSRIGVDYREIYADMSLIRDTLSVSNLHLKSTGTLDGSGELIMAFPLPKQLALSLQFANFEAVESRNLKARLSGNVELKGPVDSLTADGSLRFSEGVYRITQSTSKQIEEIDLTAELAALRGDTTEQRGILVSRFYQPMTHAIFVDIPGNVWLRGSGMNVELFGGLWIYKSRNEEPLINGEIKVRRGTVDFAGHEFKVDQDSGAVIFTGPIDDPELNIIAVEQSILRASEDRIRVRIFGTLQNSQMELSGTRADGGAMTVEEVLQRLFGAILPLASASGESSDLTGTITTAGIAQLSGVVGKMAGLDVFQFRPGNGGFSDLSGSSLEIGSYITDRLYVRVLQPIESVQGSQDVLVEYRLFDWLKLAGHQTGTKSSEFKTVLQWEWR